MLGSAFTGALLAVASGLVSPVPLRFRLIGVGMFFLLCMVRDLGWLPDGSLPENRRQIPREVLGKPEDVGFLQFGFEMGTGARTYMPTATPLVLAALIVLVPHSPLAIVLAAVFFAVGRFLPTALASTSRNSQVGLWLSVLLHDKYRAAAWSAAGILIAAVALSEPLSGGDL